jgi:hypothetical protein
MNPIDKIEASSGEINKPHDSTESDLKANVFRSGRTRRQREDQYSRFASLIGGTVGQAGICRGWCTVLLGLAMRG